jgi:hypothetical protein
MPRAGDAFLNGALPVTHDPTVRINSNPPKLAIDPAALLEMWMQWFEDYGLEIFESFTGLDFSSPQAFVTSLIQVALTGGPGLEMAEAILNMLGTLIGVPNLGELLTSLGGGLDASLLFGTLPASVLSLIPIGSISKPQRLEMTASTFPDSSSVAAGGFWTFDPAVTRSVDGTGSMRVDADGTMKAASGMWINVAEAQRLYPSIYVKWSGYVGAGSTVQMQFVQFDSAGTQVGAPVGVAAINPSAGAGGFTEMTTSTGYTVPAGVVRVRVRLVVTAAASAGTLWFDEGTYEIRSNFVDNLSSWFQLPVIGDLFGDPSSFDPSDLIPVPVLDMGNIIHEALTGVIPGGDLLEDILAALQAIPFGNVLGAGGPASIGESIFETLNNIVGGFVGSVGSGASFADVFNIANYVSSGSALGRFSFDLLGIRNNKATTSGMLATSVSPMLLNEVGGGAAATTLTVNSTTSTVLWHRFEEALSLGVISWLGNGTTNITDMRVNVWRMNPSTGIAELMYASANIIADVSASGTPQYNTHVLSTPIAVEATETYGAEIEVRATSGAHAHTVAAKQYWLPSHPTVYPRKWWSKRTTSGTTPPATIAAASVDYTATHAPFIEFAVETGLGTEFHDPQRVPFTASGSTVIPSWANYVDRIVVGPGGGGHQGGTWGIHGEGAGSGAWQSDTLTRGTHFTGTPTVTVTLGVPGSGGGGDGTAGTSSSIAVPGASTLTAAGGVPGDSFGGDKNGDSPGDRTYQGWTYRGGLQQNTYGADGNYPGGGGAGGNYVSFQAGGDGGASAAWLVFRQT